MTTFGSILSKLIAERNLTLKKIADGTGIPRSNISEWIAGRSPQLSDDLVKLAEYLGVTLDFLVTGKNQEEKLIDEIIKDTAERFVQVHRGVYRITVEKKSR